MVKTHPCGRDVPVRSKMPAGVVQIDVVLGDQNLRDVSGRTFHRRFRGAAVCIGWDNTRS
jgi:hypothetical protein